MTEAMYPCAESIGELQVAKAQGIYKMLRRTRPRSREDLKNYVKVFLGIDVPDRTLCPDHSSPMDYLWHSFNVDFSGNRRGNPLWLPGVFIMSTEYTGDHGDRPYG